MSTRIIHNGDLDEQDVPFMLVLAKRHPSGVWTLHSVETCPYCGSIRHYHGGGNGPEPTFGTVSVHCIEDHEAFRPDCQPEHRNSSHTRCYVRHHPSQVTTIPVGTRTVPA